MNCFKSSAYFVVLLVLLCVSCNNDAYRPRAVKGVLDLRDWNCHKDPIIDLDGEWEFYPYIFYRPLEFRGNYVEVSPDYVTVPGRWNDYLLKWNDYSVRWGGHSFRFNDYHEIGNKFGKYGFGTYRLKIIFHPAAPYKMSLKMHPVYTAYKLYINNIRMEENGGPGRSHRTSVASDEVKIIHFTNGKANTVTITILASNYHDLIGGICFSPKLGETTAMIHYKKNRETRDAFLFGAILIIALYHLGLFIFRKRDIAAFLFSILCFNVAVRILLVGEHYLAYYFPFAPYEMLKKVEYLTGLTMLIFIIYFRLQFPKDYPKKIQNIILTGYVIFVILVLCIPIREHSPLLWGYILILLIGLSSILAASFLAMIRKREGGLVFFLGYVVLCVAAVIEVLHNSLIIKADWYLSIGMFIFILSQSYILARKYAASYRKIESLSDQLTRYSMQLEKKVKERTLQLEVANQQKTNFFVNIAHETKTPLTLITNFLDKYIKKQGMNEELEIINRNFLKLKKQMVDFLDVEKIEKGKFIYDHSHIIDFSAVLSRICVLFNETAIRKNIEITHSIEEGVHIKIDVHAVDRIINNLLENALKYTPENGKVTLSLRALGEKAEFKVDNTGPGIPEHQLNNIFKPYYQIVSNKSNTQGIGMGLHIVKKIIDEIKGDITVVSSPGEHTVFTIVLDIYTIHEDDDILSPVTLSRPLITPMDINRLTNTVNNEHDDTVLVIDDNIEMLFYLQDNLKDEYNFFYAVNGSDALETLDKMPRPTVIISDIMMDTMDGYEFYDRLQKDHRFNDIPVIFLTAKTTVKDRLTGLSRGAIDFISKPFVIDELLAKIRSIIKYQTTQKQSNRRQFEEMVLSAIRSNPTPAKPRLDLDGFRNMYNITSREFEVIQLIAQGLENKEISAQLDISFYTVKAHVRNIFRKCEVQNRVELVQLLNNYLDMSN